MSEGRLKNVSILDFPGFASSIGTLEKSQKREPGWATELNFAILKSQRDGIEPNISDVFTKFKKLKEDWRNYMLRIDSSDYEDYWTEDMENNEYLNFTRFIKDDYKTFLTAITGIDTL